LTELSQQVRAKVPEILQPTLVMHSRRDHTCPFAKNVDFLMGHLGSSQKRAVALEESFHVVTVDSEKDRVAEETLEFVSQFRAAEPARALGA
jgi:carboxylesterase